jgi:hypothetical protein
VRMEEITRGSPRTSDEVAFICLELTHLLRFSVLNRARLHVRLCMFETLKTPPSAHVLILLIVIG